MLSIALHVSYAAGILVSGNHQHFCRTPLTTVRGRQRGSFCTHASENICISSSMTISFKHNSMQTKDCGRASCKRCRAQSEQVVGCHMLPNVGRSDDAGTMVVFVIAVALLTCGVLVKLHSCQRPNLEVNDAGDHCLVAIFVSPACALTTSIELFQAKSNMLTPSDFRGVSLPPFPLHERPLATIYV